MDNNISNLPPLTPSTSFSQKIGASLSNLNKKAHNNKIVTIASVALTALSLLAACLVFVFEMKIKAIVLPYFVLSGATVLACYLLSKKNLNPITASNSRSHSTNHNLNNHILPINNSPIPHDISNLTNNSDDFDSLLSKTQENLDTIDGLP